MPVFFLTVNEEMDRINNRYFRHRDWHFDSANIQFQSKSLMVSSIRISFSDRFENETKWSLKKAKIKIDV